MIKGLCAFAFFLMCTAAPSAHAQLSTPQGPSFSCTGAQDVDAAVCHDAGLSADDRRLNALYIAARRDVFGSGPSQQQDPQRKWLKALHADCAATTFARHTYKTQAACIADNYKDRQGALAAAALFSDHDDAMAAIRQATPADAPIYEAIYQYATIDDPKARTAKVSQTIAPIFAGLDADHTSVFTDNGGPATAAAAAASDQAFAIFVDVTVSELEHGVSWPCAAFVRRPGLLSGLAAMYGSSRDNFLPYADCDEMTPAGADGFTAFMEKTLQDAPNCDGTIRFAGGREFYRLRTAALLHRPEQWARFKADAAERPEKIFRTKQATAIAKARATLAAYYVQTFHLDTATADRDAGAITDVLISQAYNLCG